MSNGAQLATWYRDGRSRISEWMSSLSDEELATAVPGCPGWTVKDTFGHVIANPVDGLAGRISGPPDEAQTAEQVDRYRASSVAEMIAEWEGAAAIDGVIEAVGDGIAPIVIDLHVHEQDMLNALGRREQRDHPIVAWLADRGRSRNEAFAAVQADDYEMTRAMLGRRSLRQVEAWGWPDGVPDGFFVFGPRPDDLVE